MPKRPLRRRLAWAITTARGNLAEALVHRTTNLTLRLGALIAGEITSPTYGLDRAIVHLDDELLGELYSHRDAVDRIVELYNDEAEAAYLARYDL